MTVKTMVKNQALQHKYVAMHLSLFYLWHYNVFFISIFYHVWCSSMSSINGSTLMMLCYNTEAGKLWTELVKRHNWYVRWTNRISVHLKGHNIFFTKN